MGLEQRDKSPLVSKREDGTDGQDTERHTGILLKKSATAPGNRQRNFT